MITTCVKTWVGQAEKLGTLLHRPYTQQPPTPSPLHLSCALHFFS